MDPRHITFLIFINLIWGAAPVALKLGFSGMPPLLLISLRFLLASLVLLPFTRWHAGRMRLIFAIAMTAGALNFALFVIALALAGDLAPVAIAFQLNVPIATLLSIFLLREVVRWRRWLGMGMALGGGAFIAFDPSVAAHLDAFLVALACAFIGAFSLIFMRQLKEVGTFELQAWVAHLSWPSLLALSLIFESGHVPALLNANATSWLAIIYTAFGSSLVAHAGFYWLLQRYEVSHLSPFLLLAPLFTVFLSVVALGDVLTARMMIGGAVTLVGVGIIMLRDVRMAEERIVP